MGLVTETARTDQGSAGGDHLEPGSGGSSSTPGTSGRARAVGFLRHRKVEVIFYGVALGLRGFTLGVYQPSVEQWIDGPRFARIGPWDGVFSDFWAPAGYAGFLAVTRAVWDNLAFTIAVQHLAGIATAVVLAGAARRCGVRRPWHLLGGALVAFGGDYLFLEHLVMAETLFLFALATATYFGVRALSERDARWAIAASVSLAAAGLVRSNALVALAVLPCFLVSLRRRRRRQGLGLAAAAAVPGLVVVVAYLVVASSVGPYAGVSDMSGWHLYSRVAPFADCSRLSIVEEQPQLRALCPALPPGDRLGPYFYEWSADSPARELWGLDPAKDGVLRRFATEVIRRQPADYVRAVSTDLVRVFAPGFRPRAGSGQMLSAYSFAYRDPSVEAQLERAYAAEYTGTEVSVRGGAGLLPAYQDATRLPGALLLLSIIAACGGALVARQARRRQVLFILSIGMTVLLGPILLFTWDFRYVLPAAALLVLGGVAGVNALVLRSAGVRRGSDEPAEEAPGDVVSTPV